VEILIVNDGSTDRTAEVAEKVDSHQVLRIPHHTGLAYAFVTGLKVCIKHSADVIVNTDADNEYTADDIIT